MNTSPLSPKPATVRFEDGTEAVITYDRRAECRMGSLKRPLPVSALNNPDHAFAALCSWIWACMTDKDDKKYPSPDAVALSLNEELIQPNFDAFYSTWSAVQPPKEAKDPLTNGSTIGHSPASSST